MALRRQKIRFFLGVLLALLPALLWRVLPDTFWERITSASGIDERLVDAYAFMLAALIEVPAIWLLKRSREKPPRWLGVCSLVGRIFAGFAIGIFFSAAAATVMQGW